MALICRPIVTCARTGDNKKQRPALTLVQIMTIMLFMMDMTRRSSLAALRAVFYVEQ
jgi:hypothetical protein